MPRNPRVVEVRRVQMPITVGGKRYSYVFFVRIGPVQDAILDMKEDNPTSISLVPQTLVDMPGWYAFIPRWCSHQEPDRFLAELGGRTNAQCILVVLKSAKRRLRRTERRMTRRQLHIPSFHAA